MIDRDRVINRDRERRREREREIESGKNNAHKGKPKCEQLWLPCVSVRFGHL